MFSMTGNGSRKNGRRPNGNGRNGERSDPVREIDSLARHSLADTDEAILERKDLAEKFLREIEKEIAEALKMLHLLGHPWKHGDRPEFEFMRITLDKALTARKKERRDRELQLWRDLVELRERRIQVLRELAALNGGRKEQET